jgi:hypothetical protein
MKDEEKMEKGDRESKEKRRQKDGGEGAGD